MSQSSKLTPVTPVQTRLSTFFITSPSSGGSSSCRKRPLSSDSISPSPPIRQQCSPLSKQLKMSQSSDVVLISSQPDHDLDPELPTTKQDSDTEVMSEEQLKQIQLRREEAAKKRQVSLFTYGMDSSWKSALKDDLSKPYFRELIEFVENERSRGSVYPPPQDVFSWSKHCHIQDVRVVVLGQDPYHGPSQAHGLCFSVNPGVQIPPSLLNIYKELKSDISEFEAPKHGNLVSWAEQGVLLLNACLTVRAREANSHKQKGWEKFTDAIVQWINKNLNGVVFLLWGKPAQEKGSAINGKKHYVLRCAHPSPLSADRGFFGCKHFSKTNTYLENNGKRAIIWNSLAGSSKQ
ncbi:Uracil-DNA glycosylase isoform X2 [Oopsacas minuta]|uniref:Uracil-DNA glycosylase n=1 Tax=Oopsacas minuta TaxID=111878 RepID=A0AAV7JV70_9METZ|nr:Uracil-DNA glycosylase isoform X2 [Oopsacas minuta]